MRLGLAGKHRRCLFGLGSAAGMVCLILLLRGQPSSTGALEGSRQKLRGRHTEIINHMSSKQQLVRDFDITSIIVKHILEREHFLLLNVTVEGNSYTMECFAGEHILLGQLMSYDFCQCMHVLLTDNVRVVSYCQKKILKTEWKTSGDRTEKGGYELKTIKEMGWRKERDNKMLNHMDEHRLRRSQEIHNRQI